MTKREYQLKDDPAEAYRLESALRCPGGWPKAPKGFEGRCVEAIRSAAARNCGAPGGRAWKIAASIGLAAAFSGLAAWMAGNVLSGGDEEEPEAKAETVLVDEETEAISKEGKMIARKTAGIVGAALTTLSVGAAELMSEPTFVFLRPETSSFWHTATNNSMTVPIDFPEGASSATLYVSGVAYNHIYENIATDSFTFELPEADSEVTENVYDLRLVFNDSGSTVRTAKLGLIKGLSPDAEGITRCLAPTTGRIWARTTGRAVVPIPYGTTSFQVNGVETPTGLDGAQGWFAMDVPEGGVSLSLVAPGISSAVSLLGANCGVLLIVK